MLVPRVLMQDQIRARIPCEYFICEDCYRNHRVHPMFAWHLKMRMKQKTMSKVLHSSVMQEGKQFSLGTENEMESWEEDGKVHHLLAWRHIMEGIFKILKVRALCDDDPWDMEDELLHPWFIPPSGEELMLVTMRVMGYLVNDEGVGRILGFKAGQGFQLGTIERTFEKKEAEKEVERARIAAEAGTPSMTPVRRRKPRFGTRGREDR
jgi:hypothetical protein